MHVYCTKMLLFMHYFIIFHVKVIIRLSLNSNDHMHMKKIHMRITQFSISYCFFNILLFLSYLCVGVLRKVFRVLVVDYTVSHYCFSFHIWYLKYCSWFSCMMCTLKRLQIFGFPILIVGYLLLFFFFTLFQYILYTIVFILQNICYMCCCVVFLGCSKNSLFKKVRSIFFFFFQSNKFRNNAILQLFVFFILCDFTKNDKYVIIWAVYKIM